MRTLAVKLVGSQTGRHQRAPLGRLRPGRCVPRLEGSGMKRAQNVTTRLPIASDVEAGNVERLSNLINEVYDDAESGMWKRKGTRTNPAEVERLLRARALILAEIEGALVGAVKVNLFRGRSRRVRHARRRPQLPRIGHRIGIGRTR
jgi:hypothetical protein